MYFPVSLQCFSEQLFLQQNIREQHIVYTTLQLFRRISQIDRKIPMIESFILLLQERSPTILLKNLHQTCFLVNFIVFQKSVLEEHFWVTASDFLMKCFGFISRTSKKSCQQMLQGTIPLRIFKEILQVFSRCIL